MKKITLIYLVLFSIFSCTKETPKQNNTNNNVSYNNGDTTLINVAYGTHPRQIYDIHLPQNRDSSTPIILVIHGGAWKAGKKEEMNKYVNLIKGNWPSVAIVNMNYRLASNTEGIHHKEMMEDIDAAVQNILKQTKNYQISSNMAIMGASAGAQLSMIYAYKYNNNIKCVGNIFGPSKINDWAWYNSTNIWLGGKVGDILTEYVGQKWDSTAYAAVSPLSNVNLNTPPTISFHGSLDPIVPVSHSQLLKNELNNKNIDNEYYELIAFHGFNDSQASDVANKLVAFFKIYLK